MIRSSIAIVSVLMAACSMSAFDDQRDQAWSDSNGSVDLSSENYAVAVAGVTTDNLGTTIAVLGTEPLGLGVVRYDEDGVLEQFGLELSDLGATGESARPTLIGTEETITTEGGAVALVAAGGLGDLDKILVFDVGNGTPEEFATLDASACGPQGSNLGTHMTFAYTGAGLEDEIDIVAVRGNELFLFPDINVQSDEPNCLRCEVADPAKTFVGMTTVNAAQGTDTEEILVSISGSLYLFESSQLLNANGGDCVSSQTPLLGPVESPGLEDDYGAQMAVGDGNDNEHFEVAISAPEAGLVYLVTDFDQGSPGSIQAPTPLKVPLVAEAFGKGPMIFLDIDVPPEDAGEDAPETDELMIGDPTASPEGVEGAGQVFVFKLSEEDDGEWDQRAILYDSTPETDQHYGRSLAEAEFIFGEDDTDLLVVGAEGETFTLFQSLDTGEDPREE